MDQESRKQLVDSICNQLVAAGELKPITVIYEEPCGVVCYPDFDTFKAAAVEFQQEEYIEDVRAGLAYQLLTPDSTVALCFYHDQAVISLWVKCGAVS
jgi:hypothetical protein